MGAKKRRPLDLSLPPELLAGGAAASGHLEQPYGNAAAGLDLRERSEVHGFDLPDGQSCLGLDLADDTTVGVCGGIDPDLDPARPDDPNQEKGIRGGLGVDFRF